MGIDKAMRGNVKKAVVYSFLSIMFVSVVFLAYDYNDLRRPGIVVLLYHRVSENGAGKYVISPEKFEWQIKYLKKQGYQTISGQEIISAHENISESKLIILTFDDGTRDHFDAVFPVLKENGFTGIFFIITKYIGAPGNLTANEIKEMSLNNMEIGSHTYSHPFLDELEESDIDFQLKKSKDDLEKIIGRPVTFLALPGGWFDERTVKLAKKLGYKALFSCKIGVNSLRYRRFVFDRIEVPGEITNDQFKELLTRNNVFMLKYKIIQTLKFFLHDLIGSHNYSRLARTL